MIKTYVTLQISIIHAVEHESAMQKNKVMMFNCQPEKFPKTLRPVREIRHRRIHTLRFQLYDV